MSRKGYGDYVIKKYPKGTYYPMGYNPPLDENNEAMLPGFGNWEQIKKHEVEKNDK